MADGATLFGDAAEITFKIFNSSKIGFIFFERIQGWNMIHLGWNMILMWD